jgi:Fe2+ or Zn2+ uptake regulation protein
VIMSQELTAALRQRGMRVTPQRVVVHRALRELGRHVTADELLDAVTDRLPSVSLPTIYATLELLEQLGMVRRVQRAGTTLFDPRIEPHHHLVCTTCGSVEDLESQLDTSALERAAARNGFESARVEALVHGRCRVCAARSRRPCKQPAHGGCDGPKARR